MSFEKSDIEMIPWNVWIYSQLLCLNGNCKVNWINHIVGFRTEYFGLFSILNLIELESNQQSEREQSFIIDQPVYDAGLFLFSEGKQNYTLCMKAKYAEGIFISIQGRERK